MIRHRPAQARRHLSAQPRPQVAEVEAQARLTYALPSRALSRLERHLRPKHHRGVDLVMHEQRFRTQSLYISGEALARFQVDLAAAAESGNRLGWSLVVSASRVKRGGLTRSPHTRKPL